MDKLCHSGQSLSELLYHQEHLEPPLRSHLQAFLGTSGNRLKTPKVSQSDMIVTTCRFGNLQPSVQVVEAELNRIPRELSDALRRQLWSIVYMPQASAALCTTEDSAIFMSPLTPFYQYSLLQKIVHRIQMRREHSPLHGRTPCHISTTAS